MKFEDIAKRLTEDSLSENEIDSYRRFCAAWLFRMNEEYGLLSAHAAVWATAHRDEYKSQAETERAWEATEEGQKMLKLKYRIRGVEALSDALQGSWFLRQREWKEAGRI